MTFRKSVLRPLDIVRGIPGRLGLRPYRVAVRVRTWNGSRPGVDSSSSSDVDNFFWVDGGTHRARVRQLTQREVIASAGAYSDQDLRVGPITPPYTGGAANHSSITIFDPSPTGAATEVFFLIDGPGMQSGGAWFEKISQDVTRPLHYQFVVRRTGRAPS